MKDNPNDKVYTPDHIVQEVLSHYGHIIDGAASVLEPFKGEGAFYKPLKELKTNTDWCEIDEGRCFFEYDKKVDAIITNPPYSIFKEVLRKCLETADDVVLLIPVSKLVSSMPRLMDVKRYGCGIKEIYYLGSGRQLKFPFGFPVAAIHIQKGWDEGYYIEVYHPRCYKAKAR